MITKKTADKMRNSVIAREERLHNWFESYWNKWQAGQISDEKMEQVAEDFHAKISYCNHMRAELNM